MSLIINDVLGNVADVLTEKEKKRGVLIHSFQQIQEEHNYLPEAELIKLSKNLDIPLTDVYSTATFYKQFYFTPRGRTIVRVCTGTACHVRGASTVMDRLKNKFKIEEGETTTDLAMTLETVGCIGCCGLAPVATVNENIVGEIDNDSLNEMIEKIAKDKTVNPVEKDK